jgi:serine phosphatase RsbU (regulator of sigma subunit)
VRREDITGTLAALRDDVRHAADIVVGSFRRLPGPDTHTPHAGKDGKGNPVRTARAVILRVLLVLIFIELAGAVAEGIATGSWERLGFDLIVAGALYIAWDKITRITREKREEYRRRVEGAGERVKLWDALVFSLLWTEDIYADIPADRRRLVGMAYTLITLGLLAAFAKIGEGFLPLIVAGSLVLAAVNLLGWVVSRERGARESLATELRLARAVQLSLMPVHPPDVPGLSIAGSSLPATEVGGDHFDYVLPPGGAHRLGVAVVDVSGKGIQAAMSAVFTSGAFRSEAARSDSPAAILTRLNRAVYGSSPRGHFVAFLYAVVDPDRRRLTFANAGQVKPLLLRNGAPLPLDALGVTFALGMTADAAYEDRDVALEPGDVLLFLTDGIVEAMNGAQEVFGDERLMEVLSTSGAGDLHPETIARRLLEAVEGHSNGAMRNDDRTLVAVRLG